jgi:hypothetical protein
LRLTLAGAGGGDFRLCVRGSDLEVSEPGTDARAHSGADAPDAWIRQTADDFLAAFEPAPDLPVLLPPGWNALDLLCLDPRDAEMLASLSGRIRVEVLGKRRRRWALDLAVGSTGMSAGRPRATIRLDGATYEAINRRAVAPVQALLDGRVSLEGDRALALQASMLLAARLSR